MPETLRANLQRNLDRVRQRMTAALARAGRSAVDAHLIGVTKSVDTTVARELFDLGLKDLGENRIQELERKARAMPREARWHAIGPIQGNKARKALQYAGTLHAIDRGEMIPKLDVLAGELGVHPRGFLEVNVSGEAAKHGIAPRQVLDTLESARNCAHLRIAGLMTMAPLEASPEEQRSIFRQLRKLRDDAARAGLFVDVDSSALSMGMSSDFEIALEEGATHVRVGSALFENLTSVEVVP